MSGKESLQHKSTRRCCELLGKWTAIASSKTWDGSATHMWTRCPRQAWPHSSLTTKHYQVLVGNHHYGEWSPCISHMISSYEGTSSPWTSQSVAWCARNTYRMEAANLSNHRVLRTCMTNLGWFQRSKNKLSRIHGGNLHQMHVNQRKSLLSSNKYFMNGAWRKCLHKFPTLAGCSTWIMEETRCCWWAQ